MHLDNHEIRKNGPKFNVTHAAYPNENQFSFKQRDPSFEIWYHVQLRLDPKRNINPVPGFSAQNTCEHLLSFEILERWQKQTACLVNIAPQIDHPNFTNLGHDKFLNQMTFESLLHNRRAHGFAERRWFLSVCLIYCISQQHRKCVRKYSCVCV